MENQRYGGFWRRFAAFMIDKTIVYALSLNVSVIVLLVAGLRGDFMAIIQTPSEEIAAQLGALASFCLFLSVVTDMVYFTWFSGVGGQTPGKMLLRLRIVTVSGEPITPGTAFLRWTGYLVSGLFFFLGFFWIALDRRKQGWHDKIALTVVTRLEKGSAMQKVEPGRKNGETSPVSFNSGNIPPVPSFPAQSPVTADSSSSRGKAPDYYEISGHCPDNHNSGEKGLDKQGEIL